MLIYFIITKEAASLEGLFLIRHTQKMSEYQARGLMLQLHLLDTCGSSHFWPCSAECWLSLWPAAPTWTSMWLAWSGTWTRDSAPGGWRRCTAPTGRTPATPWTTRILQVVRLDDEISGRSAGNDLLTLHWELICFIRTAMPSKTSSSSVCVFCGGEKANKCEK